MISIPTLQPSLFYYKNTPSIALIPTMTDNTTPNGYVASANLNSGTAYYAFDSNLSTYWTPGYVSGPNWIQLQFPLLRTITMFQRSNDGATPTNFIIAGSLDGVNWNTIFNGINNTSLTIPLTNSTAYQYYRITAQNSTFGTIVFSTIQLYGY